MTKLILPARQLVALAKYAASTEKTRYYFCGVHVEKGVMVATDGHRLLAAHHDADVAENVILGRDAILKLKTSARTPDDCEVTIDGSEYRIDYNGAAFVGSVVDGSFPDWRRVLPGVVDEPAPAAYSGRYYAEMNAAAKMCNTSCAIIPNGDAPAPVRFVDGSMFGALMPKRAELADVRPGWLTVA